MFLRSMKIIENETDSGGGGKGCMYREFSPQFIKGSFFYRPKLLRDSTTTQFPYLLLKPSIGFIFFKAYRDFSWLSGSYSSQTNNGRTGSQCVMTWETVASRTTVNSPFL